MILARVLGNVVATQKNARYENARVMIGVGMTPRKASHGERSALGAKSKSKPCLARFRPPATPF